MKGCLEEIGFSDKTAHCTSTLFVFFFFLPFIVVYNKPILNSVELKDPTTILS